MKDNQEIIPRTQILFGQEEKEAIEKVLNSGIFVKGPEVDQFEKEFANYCGVKYAIAVNSGTSALHLSLLSVGLEPKDEVITVPNTFVATTNAIVKANGIPKLVDVDQNSMNMNIEQLNEIITPNTKVIMPVHLYGLPVDMDPLMELAEEHNLIVIEDSCQAHGAEYKGRKTGSLGHISSFSFYPTKNLTVGGDGGMIVTNDEEKASLMRMLRDHGRESTFSYKYIGFNFRMSEILGAIGRVRLSKLDWANKERRKIAEFYYESLSIIPQINLPCDTVNSKHVYYLYVPQFQERDLLKEFLRNKGISTAIDYPMTINQIKPYQKQFGMRYGMFPVAEELTKTILAIPMYPELTNQQIEQVTSNIHDFYKR